MPIKYNSFTRTLVACMFSAIVCAQDAPTLKEAVRDNYIDVIEDQALTKLDGNTPFSDLDGYSHFLSEQELADTSLSLASQAFVQHINAQSLYLRIPVFHIKTSTQVHTALAELLNNADIRTIVIDLRGNRGGLLNAAIEVADEFIDSGEIASTKGRQDQSNLLFLAKLGGLAESTHLLVLVDKNTASAAELLAGTLRIKRRAQLIGQNTYGKSAVQTHIQLKSGEALSLTTATYYFSDGSLVQRNGLLPDRKIPTWTLKRHPPLLINEFDRSNAGTDKFLMAIAAKADK